MDNFMKYFFEDFGRVFRAFLEIFSSIFNFLNYLLNFPMRMQIIDSYAEDFGTTDWILLLVANLVLIALLIVLIILFVKLFRRIFRFRIPVKEYDRMKDQVRSLQRDLMRANYEKDRLLSMKIAELGGDPAEALKALQGELAPEGEKAEEGTEGETTEAMV